MFQYRQALVRMRAGDTDREIARSRLMGREKLAAWRALAQTVGWLDAQQPLPDDGAIATVVARVRRARSSVSTVEPYRERVQAWVDAGVSGKAIHEALAREHGYTGSYSSVARLLVHLRPKHLEPTVRLHFEPGDAAQVDFGAGPMLEHPDGKLRRTWAFVMTLASSRHQYVEFVWDQTVATWLGCHRRAFEWFAGVPRRVIIDNAKCAITKACAKDPVVQRAYAECAEGYGFRIEPCPPHDPQKKGIVEAGVKYVKRNFLPTRSFRDLADLNAQARAWVLGQAGSRIHGTTRIAPLALFEIERGVLQPLPAAAPDMASWHRVSVHRDAHVQFDQVLYSVPFTRIGQRLWLRATDTAVALYEDYVHVTTHPRGLRRGQRVTLRDHLPPDAQAFFAHDRGWCVEQAQRIGTRCAELVARLLDDRIVERLRAAQGVLGLVKPYGAQRLEAACARALAHESPFFRTVKTILVTGADLQATSPPTTPEAYGRARFVRSAASLFDTVEIAGAPTSTLH